MKQAEKIRKRANREYLRLFKEMHGCSVCDEKRAICLDFHHKDPKNKRFSLSDADTYGIKSIEAEIAKCVLVCANCHRALHAEDIMRGLIKARTKEEILPLFDLI